MDLTGIDPDQLEKLAGKLGITVERLTSVTIDELADLLKQHATKQCGELSDEVLQEVAGGEGVLDDIDPMLLELVRSLPKF